MRDLIYSIKCFVIVFVVAFLVNAAASAQSPATAIVGIGASYVVNNNNYSAAKTPSNRVKSEPKKTDYTWTDRKGNVYPIYITDSGSCFTIRTSATTGKEYRSYLKPDVAQDICRKMGYEYKSKKKENK